ncbi:HAD family hydrolase [Streptomyces indicus]|uniref:Haloacid dehalogenase superfamily, subfamily IA, variant 3 with third motif having DD or ED/haloacid dehalogenase superfamily, subfamily IA, variant 1 with third motif having Dx(3-4)D or Dx(3-4)E n=1 Tax=Streptomyces indicus TaxID=417292 RepID=A0A1G9HA27_9ACTN|nr:HAD-IA family hydrolase [Streptomyces indicus]SDL09634.1 haloacid dehalogenase superfamily, subfamily IA, variant 3 with third motif having DD or ED/haloacid dehalogenase superfamily, subfamily IA, variant 1 with third motif having Dx(3-4)D or Dx(3-4)E [Streptomyces indicus]
MIERVRNVITGKRAVLFDFDGPICRLFAGHPASDVTRHLLGWLAQHGGPGAVDPAWKSDDPHALLREVDRTHTDRALIERLEDELTQQELKATGSAYPTPYVDRLIQTWSATGVGLAVTTNNSPLAVERYLTARRLRQCFTGGIHGRTHEVHHLKPDPSCLHRALDSLQVPPSAALMIGDTSADLHAARAAGVAFLGYGRDPHRQSRLHTAGADLVVDSLEPVLELVWETAARH